jgi:hypothetical protein
MQRLLFIIPFLCLNIILFAQLKSPDEFFPHKRGENFTPHYMLVDYYEHVAANSAYLKLTEYGRTNEQRPLLLAAISTPENLARLDEIRQNNLRRTGLTTGTATNENIAIVWLGFSIHGNEAAGSEAAPQVLYELVDPNNATTKEWLKNTIVLIDPSVNPDGYSRYTEWYRRYANTILNPNPNAYEHLEPWPGGRVNHYLFDLNRDWAWQTQVESQQRMKVYHEWMPHVVADIHEQGYNNPYYFAPAAQPYHQFITPFQRDFQVEIGKNHAKYFDQNDWLYFTKEVFDLLYPSYGDTYPTYSGAVGMTYEQGGGGRAGRGIITETGDTLTLLDRILHHKTTALSTVEVASKNALRLVQNFTEFYQKSRNGQVGEFKTFVIKGTNPQGRLKALTALLDKNFIQYQRAGKSGSLKGYDYQNNREIPINIAENDLIINTFQSKSVLAHILFEPKTEVVDSLTYDITAWSLPYAYGLEAYASRERFDGQRGYTLPNYANNLTSVQNPYAFVATWNSLNNARFLSALLKKGVKVRFATENFEVENQTYNAGTLVITGADNRKMPDFVKTVTDAAQQFQQEIRAVQTGFVTNGKDFGSSSYGFIETPKIAILGGEGTYNNSFGQVWYYFEQDLQYPVTVISAQNLSRMNLEDFNVIIMSEGNYTINDALADKLNNWMNNGGRLIAIGDALRSLEDKKGFNLTRYANTDDKSAAEKAEQQAELDHRFDPFAGQARRYIMEDIPGAIFKVKVDNTHPLGYGLPNYYFSLKSGTMSYQPLKNAWNVGTLGKDLTYVGFVGTNAKEAMKNTFVFAVQDKGQGSVTYFVDNPLFRAFWENGKFLFSNAVFLVGQ